MVIKSVLLEFTTRKEFESKIIECKDSKALKVLYIQKNKAVFVNQNPDSDVVCLQLQMLIN